MALWRDMRLIEIIVNITTRYLEQERTKFIDIINSIVSNNMPIKEAEFSELLDMSSIMMKKYNIDDPAFSEILDSFSRLVSYYRRTQK